MRTLVISDLHGNRAALEAIAAAEDFDEVLCLGDVVGYGPEPSACVRWLRTHDALVVQGNHDRAFGEGVPPRCSARFAWLAEATSPIGVAQLRAEDREWLAALPRWLMIDRGGLRIMLVHAIPSDPLYAYREADPAVWRREVAGVSADLLLVGHTHLPFELVLGDARVVNPGSAGQPKDGDARAAYAMLERDTIRLARVAYPVEETVAALTATGIDRRAIDAMSSLLRAGRVPAPDGAVTALAPSARQARTP